MGFFEDILDRFKYEVLNIRTPELEEKMRLKNLKEKLKNQKYNFLNFKTETIHPDFAKYIYKLYVEFDPIGKMLKEDFINNKGHNIGRQLIEGQYSEKELETLQALSRESMMNEIIKSGKVNEVFAKTKEDFKRFQKKLTQDKVSEINATYNYLKEFAGLTNFDFFLFLKTFDNSFPEGSYNHKAQFAEKDAKIVVDDIIKLDCALHSVQINKTLVDALDRYIALKQAKHVTPKQIKSLVGELNNLKSMGILSDMVIFILKDFEYTPTSKVEKENICTEYMNNIAKQLKADMESIVKQLKEGKIEKLKEKVFQNTAISRMNNYIPEKNKNLKANKCDTFKYIEAMEFLKTFVIEKYERYMKDAINEIIVSAEYQDKTQAGIITDGFYVVNEAREKIVAFDKELSETAEEGKRLKGLIASLRKSPGNRELITNIVRRVDENAVAIIRNNTKALKKINTMGQSIISDAKEGTKKTIVNGKDLINSSKQIIETFEASVNEIGYFLKLMENYTPS